MRFSEEQVVHLGHNFGEVDLFFGHPWAARCVKSPPSKTRSVWTLERFVMSDLEQVQRLRVG